MDANDFLTWRKALRYTQEEAGEKIGVTRATIQNWEKGITRVPRIAELACQQLTRKWKQRPDFGPVTLIYADEPIRPTAEGAPRAVFAQCELHSNNEFAIRRILRLSETQKFVTQLIVEQNGGIVWTISDLQRECTRRRAKARRRGAQGKASDQSVAIGAVQGPVPKD